MNKVFSRQYKNLPLQCLQKKKKEKVLMVSAQMSRINFPLNLLCGGSKQPAMMKKHKLAFSQW